ncbi:Eco57I restriction-modification methylase domain-containing protein [Candidatus Mycolicibacterium alkanivorans]|uniref:site-specific DNA-methyltransferase (adenine-specific) n=1 Tax=Candidatus Mycolicibacterium alkanivorans TaxID=2954114 RepID=A0ABS9YXG6_9MYCO|nr:N-6 DNA methylase [Candidatus Mycolicibacterium alkanivorans]MCI4675607.1 N-6 DNA methylase [Candidatus Mycolicibacterium alkanivorans]
MSTDTASTNFVGVRIVGGLLPADLLAKLVAAQTQDGLSSKDFHLAAGETVRDAANRVWAYLRGAWTTYRAALAALPDNDAATGLTRERFALVLLDQLGYGRVHPTGKGGLHVGDRSFPISHLWGNVPIHLLGRVAVDTRTKGVAGAAGASPQSMVQELLNRSDDHLWAILANATTLRLIRDSTSLVGSAYVEFDLEAIFDGDLFADFLLLYSLCHVSRLEPRDPEVGPASCWLEHWRQDAIQSGSRALNLLRDGVIQALHTLGSGFLTHPDNATLRQDLADGQITVEEINHALLRVTYRLLFTFVAEDRNALLDPHADPQVRRRYLDYFSTERLRRTSRRRRGGRYGDRWEALKVVWRGLGSVDGLPELGLPGIGGLFDTGALDFLMDCSLSNQALQSAVRSLSLVKEPRSQAMRIVDYRNLGAEELGSIYESLLELMPSWDPATKTYSLAVASGNQRKDTGSYYTPTSLVESLLDTALDPILNDAEKSDEPEQALLCVTVCDPACGSGHFLVGAARRIAKRVAALRTGDPEPAPEAVRSAMRDVVGRCIYGVDLNPLAAELAKVSLWLEALDPGRPLTFLDAQIRIGNALVGATPRLLAGGLPDEAFKPIEGDDKKITATLAKQNKAERSAQGSLFDVDMVAANTKLAEQVEKVVAAPALSLDDVHVQEQRLRAYTQSTAYRQQRLAADAWCAAFVWPKSLGAPPAITQRTITTLSDGDDKLTDKQRAEIERLTAEYRFFHWHLEFPHIFPTESTDDDTVNDATGWYGGFSVVIGNPPWEHVELKEQEYFEARDPDIAKAAGAKRKRMITELLAGDSPVGRDYMAAKRRLDGVRHFAANSGLYPLCGRGRIKTDPLFAETGRALLAGEGRSGMILPTAIATDSTTQYFFKNLVQSGSISSLYDFENRKPLFEAVDSRYKFCLLTLAGRDLREPEADFAFFAHDPTDLERPGSRFSLTPEEITLLNPNTGTCPIFRSRRDAEITLGIYRRVPVLIREGDPDGNPWGVRFMQGLFNMTSDSHLFRTRDELEGDSWTLRGNVFFKGQQEMLPLYEAKMIHHYDHRWATYQRDGTVRDVTLAEKQDPNFVVMPRYWVDRREVDTKLEGRWTGEWLIGWRDICRSTDVRTVIAGALPLAAVGDKFLLALVAADVGGLLQAMWSSFVYDYCARQKIGGTSLKYFTFMQLPAQRPDVFSLGSEWDAARPPRKWVIRRVDYLRSEWSSPPIRTVAKAELDAAFFHLYGIERNDVDYIMETFPIVKRKDIAEHGEYRTKRLILEMYDAMAEAGRTGKPYESPFDEKAGTAR